MKYTCKSCQKTFDRPGKKPAVFCSLGCKGDWQRTQKPVDREWLHQKYVVERLGIYQIAQMVGRNPKQVWHWLKGYNLPIRNRDWEIEPGTQPYHEPEWLRAEYVDKRRSAADIAKQFGVLDSNIIHFLRKFGIKRRTIAQARKVKRWGALGDKNPMYGKRGKDSPNWKGGSTPERQAFYSSIGWHKAVKTVWKRDKGTCQRCGIKKDRRHKDLLMHIHHSVSFLVKELRAEPSNLVLLCADCHHWVHSNDNVNRDFISE